MPWGGWWEWECGPGCDDGTSSDEMLKGEERGRCVCGRNFLEIAAEIADSDLLDVKADGKKGEDLENSILGLTRRSEGQEQRCRKRPLQENCQTDWVLVTIQCVTHFKTSVLFYPVKVQK